MATAPNDTEERKVRPANGRRLRFFALLCATLIIAVPETGAAQERRTLLDILFGQRRAAPAQSDDRFRAAPQPQRNRPPKRAARPTPPAPPPPMAVEKLADARKLLVAGDFVASGAGDGLTEAFLETPGVLVVEKPNGSSGLVRDDYYDWLKELPVLLDQERPAVLIMAIGTNDRQQMNIGGVREKYGTDAWLAEYSRRVAALASIAAERKIPQIWLGLPPYQAPSLSAYAASINTLLQPVIEKAGGQFVDVWDGFSDENGKFVATGSDINGKPVRLRSTDGIGLTKAGRRKLAFYLEKPVRDLVGGAVETATAPAFRLDKESLPDILNLSAPGSGMLETTIPMAITDPALDGGSELMGTARASFPQSSASPRRALLERGELPPAPQGRADSVRLPAPPVPP